MDNWEDISSDFTEELEQEWKNFGFTYKQTEEWIEKGGLTIEDAGLAFCLKEQGYTAEDVLEQELDLEWYRETFVENNLSFEKTIDLEKKVSYSESKEPKELEPKNWQGIHLDFTPEIIEAWNSFGFTYEQTREWINIGLTPQDYSFTAWLRDNEINAEWVLNNGNLEQLKETYQCYSENKLIAQVVHKDKNF